MVYSIVGLILFVLLILFIGFSYNTLVLWRNRFLNAFSQIDVQLKRRYDLIPNLVEAVKGYMAHEKQTLEAVIAARNVAAGAAASASAGPADAGLMTGLITAENALVGALGRFRMLSEAYPQLKADRNALNLMEELGSTENRVAFARQAYNDSATVYNTRRQTFPINLVASLFGFTPATLFQIDNADQRQNVQINLNPAERSAT
jgi:LemA protein